MIGELVGFASQQISFSSEMIHPFDFGKKFLLIFLQLYVMYQRKWNILP
jgi:hypothetical protein